MLDQERIRMGGLNKSVYFQNIEAYRLGKIIELY